MDYKAPREINLLRQAPAFACLKLNHVNSFLWKDADYDYTVILHNSWSESQFSKHIKFAFASYSLLCAKLASKQILCHARWT